MATVSSSTSTLTATHPTIRFVHGLTNPTSASIRVVTSAVGQQQPLIGVAWLTNTEVVYNWNNFQPGNSCTYVATVLGTIDSSGDSLWEEEDSDTITPSEAGVDSVLVTEDDDDSRDNPKAVYVVQNTGLPHNPRVIWGNPYLAGVGAVAIGWWYTDDTLDGVWLLFGSFEKTGTFSPVLDGVRRSGLEVHLNHGDPKPITRVFEASAQAMQIGAGGFLVAPGGAVRAAGVLTLTTAEVYDEATDTMVQQEHKMGQGQKLYKEAAPNRDSTGEVAVFGANGELWGPSGTTRTIATVVDEHTITVSDARADAVNTEWLVFGVECAGDVEYGRDSYGVGALRAKNANRLLIQESGPVVPEGLSLLGGGEDPLPLGSNGVACCEVDAGTLHVLEGKTFYNQGTYKSTGWYNGGGQTQSTQEVFVVGTGSGNKTTTMRVIGGVDWMVFRVFNHGEGGSNTLQINAGAANTINGAASITIGANASVTLVSVGTDWRVQYHAAPP